MFSCFVNLILYACLQEYNPATISHMVKTAVMIPALEEGSGNGSRSREIVSVPVQILQQVNQYVTYNAALFMVHLCVASGMLCFFNKIFNYCCILEGRLWCHYKVVPFQFIWNRVSEATCSQAQFYADFFIYFLESNKS